MKVLKLSHISTMFPNWFESSVIYEGTKTCDYLLSLDEAFESSVIYEGTKTNCYCWIHR